MWGCKMGLNNADENVHWDNSCEGVLINNAYQWGYAYESVHSDIAWKGVQ